MPPKIKELEVIALTADLPAEGLLRGLVGTVVHVPMPSEGISNHRGAPGESHRVIEKDPKGF